MKAHHPREGGEMTSNKVLYIVFYEIEMSLNWKMNQGKEVKENGGKK